MSRIDLIPSEYRERQRRQRLARRVALAAGLAVLALAGVRLALGFAVEGEQARLAALESRKAQATSDDARIAALEQRKAGLEDRVKTLETVLRGPDLDAVFIALDRALPAEVRFLELRFLRRGEFVDAKPQATAAGYFLVVPKDGAAGRATGAAWRLEQHLEIKGQAASHAVLAEFIRTLGEHAPIREVRLLDTGLRSYVGTQVVDFHLAAALASGTRGR